MKFPDQVCDFIAYTNRHQGEVWHLEILEWPAGWQIKWTCRDKFVALDPVLARHVCRHMRAHFEKVFLAVPKNLKQPEAESACLEWCDRFDAMAKAALHNNRRKVSA